VRESILLLLSAALALGACYGHPTYGRPGVRDTIPSTKEPQSPQPRNDPPPPKEHESARALSGRLLDGTGLSRPFVRGGELR
jgi:hypothetical protein